MSDFAPKFVGRLIESGQLYPKIKKPSDRFWAVDARKFDLNFHEVLHEELYLSSDSNSTFWKVEADRQDEVDWVSYHTHIFVIPLEGNMDDFSRYMIHYDSILEVYRVSKYKEFTICRSRPLGNFQQPALPDRAPARQVSAAPINALVLPLSEPFNWADDVEEQLEPIADNCPPAHTVSTHEHTAPTSSTAVVTLKNLDDQNAQVAVGVDTKDQGSSINHPNADEKTVVHATTTRSEVSPWFQHQKYKGFAVRDLPLGAYCIRAFLEALKGKTNICRQPVGSWVRDELPIAKIHPLEGWAPVLWEPIKAGSGPYQPTVNSALGLLTSGSHAGTHPQQSANQHHATVQDGLFIASTVLDMMRVSHSQILEERDSEKIDAENAELYGIDAEADDERYDFGTHEEQGDRLQQQRIEHDPKGPRIEEIFDELEDSSGTEAGANNADSASEGRSEDSCTTQAELDQIEDELPYIQRWMSSEEEVDEDLTSETEIHGQWYESDDQKVRISDLDKPEGHWETLRLKDPNTRLHDIFSILEADPPHQVDHVNGNTSFHLRFVIRNYGKIGVTMPTDKQTDSIVFDIKGDLVRRFPQLISESAWEKQLMLDDYETSPTERFDSRMADSRALVLYRESAAQSMRDARLSTPMSLSSCWRLVTGPKIERLIICPTLGRLEPWKNKSVSQTVLFTPHEPRQSNPQPCFESRIADSRALVLYRGSAAQAMRDARLPTPMSLSSCRGLVTGAKIEQLMMCPTLGCLEPWKHKPVGQTVLFTPHATRQSDPHSRFESRMAGSSALVLYSWENVGAKLEETRDIGLICCKNTVQAAGDRLGPIPVVDNTVLDYGPKEKSLGRYFERSESGSNRGLNFPVLMFLFGFLFLSAVFRS